jgi:hypothetical protein
MSRIVSAALSALAAVILTAGIAAAAQPLTIDDRTDQLRVDHLDRYTNGEPVAVRVQAQPAQGVALLLLAPDGTSTRVPLALDADGSFSGTVTLAAPGTWTLAIAVNANGVQTTSQSFVAIVTDARATYESVLTMLGLALVSIGGGIGLIAVGRKSALAAQAQPGT